MTKQAKIPVILYESEEQALPYIEIQEDETMPAALFIQEYKHTGEVEPGENGEEAPVVNMLIHMYANMKTLQEKLPGNLYDKVRTCLGLQPVAKAKAEGQKILDKVYVNAGANAKEQNSNKESTKNKIKEEFTRKLNEKLTRKFYSTDSKKETKETK